jgi:hypothetical protein
MHEHIDGLRVHRNRRWEHTAASLVIREWWDGQPVRDVSVLTTLDVPATEVEFALSDLVLSSVCSYINAGGDFDAMLRLIEHLRPAAVTAKFPEMRILDYMDLGYKVFYAETAEGLMRIVDGVRIDPVTEEQMKIELESGEVDVPSALRPERDGD